jgi:hypothetical protein
MKPASASVWNVTSGRRTVGKVWALTVGENAGKFQCRIERETAIAHSPEAAFRAAGSRALGYSDEHELRAHNRQVRAQRRAHRANARAMLAEFANPHATFEDRTAVLDRIFGFSKSK